VRLWDPATGRQHSVLQGHTSEVAALCALELGGRTMLASAGDDQTVRLWDPITGRSSTIPIHYPATCCTQMRNCMAIGVSTGLLILDVKFFAG
jgi:WD40 repeat protein